MAKGGQIYRLLRNPYILFSLLVTGLFLISFLQHPDPTSPSFQFPSLFPSAYPPTRVSSDPYLTEQLLSLRSNLTTICPDAPVPVYTQARLTLSQEKRYAHLRRPRIPGRTTTDGTYVLVTTIRQIQAQLPDLLNTVLVLITFLGPERLSFSIYEGPSDDCTPNVLEHVLLPFLVSLGVSGKLIRLQTRAPQIDFNQHNRIQALAELRNQALAPLWEDSELVRDVVAVVAFNDVYLRASDVLELLHQHIKAGERSGQETGITTGMDYYERLPEWYYDVWVGRTVSPRAPRARSLADIPPLDFSYFDSPRSA